MKNEILKTDKNLIEKPNPERILRLKEFYNLINWDVKSAYIDPQGRINVKGRFEQYPQTDSDVVWESAAECGGKARLIVNPDHFIFNPQDTIIIVGATFKAANIITKKMIDQIKQRTIALMKIKIRKDVKDMIKKVMNPKQINIYLESLYKDLDITTLPNNFVFQKNAICAIARQLEHEYHPMSFDSNARIIIKYFESFGE